MTSFSASTAHPSTIQLSMEMETEDNLPLPGHRVHSKPHPPPNQPLIWMPYYTLPPGGQAGYELCLGSQCQSCLWHVTLHQEMETGTSSIIMAIATADCPGSPLTCSPTMATPLCRKNHSLLQLKNSWWNILGGSWKRGEQYLPAFKMGIRITSHHTDGKESSVQIWLYISSKNNRWKETDCRNDGAYLVELRANNKENEMCQPLHPVNLTKCHSPKGWDKCAWHLLDIHCRCSHTVVEGV
jgi:hypothetical protein